MLLETVLHEKYIEHLNSEKIPFEHEVGILRGIVDFKVNFDGKFIGVEVKADRSNLFSALGQLLNTRRTFSDVYLLSTEEFYTEINEVLMELGIQDQFGFIIFKKGEFITVSKPKTKNYYFNEKNYRPPRKKKTKTLAVDQNIISFLERYKDKAFLCCDVSNELKINMALAQKRISGWKKFGLIEEINHIGLPKPFRVLEVPKEEYVYLS